MYYVLKTNFHCRHCNIIDHVSIEIQFSFLHDVKLV